MESVTHDWEETFGPGTSRISSTQNPVETIYVPFNMRGEKKYQVVHYWFNTQEREI